MKKSPKKRQALSRERILRCALSIVDAEGLDAVSMRRVGEALGVEAMSLYNHVANKAAILDGVFETVLAELPAPKRSATWEAALRDRARALRCVLRAHPNALPIFATRPAVTPASLAHVEHVLDSLRGAGFSTRQALSAFQVVVTYVVGHTLACYAPGTPGETSRPAYDQLNPEQFPRVREAAALLPGHDLEREFEFGLDALLVGFGALLARKHQR